MYCTVRYDLKPAWRFTCRVRSTKLVYTASEPIGTITYGSEQGLQRNAIRLEGLPLNSN